MRKLQLLFTKGGLQYRLSSGAKILSQNSYLDGEGQPEKYFGSRLTEILEMDFDSVSAVSALNHFTLMPADFDNHDAGYDLIALNAPMDRETEELMLSVNKKYGVQFYFTLPKNLYSMIKSTGKTADFNFSGEKFLSLIQIKTSKEIHINLYHNQCEFFAFDDKKVILYNNLDMDSEVDFLYFIMFTVSKIGFGLNETSFLVYGETTENETFISELGKFASSLKIVFDNIPGKNFILN